MLLRDAEQGYLAIDLTEEGPGDSMNQLQGHSITYRIAVGPHQGHKVFTLQTLPGSEEPFIDTAEGGCGFLAACQRGCQRERTKQARANLRGRPRRYISRPAVSEKRLSLTSQGEVRYELKTTHRDGSTGRPSDRAALRT